MIRRLARSAIELAAVGTGLTALARTRARDSIAILAWHNVVPAGEAGHADASLHLPVDRFVRQIERLARTHDIIDIEDAAAPPRSGRPRAIITFDDAYRGAVTLALPELVRRGLPAVVFVAPALLGTPSTWWDELAEAKLLSDDIRDDALTSHAGRGDVIRRRVFASDALPSLPHSYGIATADELRAHCGDSVRLGSHSWGHEYLPALAARDLKQNLARSLEWIESFDGPSTRWLALPYGGGDTDVGRAAMDVGHTGVLRISGGLWRPRGEHGADRAQVPRVNVPAGVSVHGLELRTSGLRT